MASRAGILSSIVVFSLLALCFSVEASRQSMYFPKAGAYNNPAGGENGGYKDSKEWYPTGTEPGADKSYSANTYYAYDEGKGYANAYGNPERENFRNSENGCGGEAQYSSQKETSRNGYAGDAQYFSQNEKYGNGEVYGNSREWQGSKDGFGQGSEFGSGYGKVSNNGYGEGNRNEFSNGNAYGVGYVNGNRNGEYGSGNGYYQQNP